MLLILLGYGSFCLAIGIIVFNMTASRRIYTKSSFVDSFDHVKDNKIMTPLLLAKSNWNNKPIEKVFVKAHTFWLVRLLLKISNSKKDVVGDLYMHKSFSENKTLAILVHGFSDSSSGMAYLAEAYYEKGISSLAVNLFAHGESSGNFCGLGSSSTDGLDILAWVNYIRNRFGADTKIILHGVSMGGATVIQAAFDHRIPVALVVSDCAFSDFETQVKSSVRKFLPGGFVSLALVNGIMFFTSLINFFVNGFWFSQNSPQKVLQSAENTDFSIPLLIFHGAHDNLVLPKYAQDIYDSASEPKVLVTVANAPHIGSWFYDKDCYMEKIESLLQ